MIPVESPKPYDAPDTPVFPPLSLPPKPAPGDDGDRDEDDADIETPVPVVQPSWMDMISVHSMKATLTPDEYRRMLLSNFDAGLQAAKDDLTAYHSHLCECPACADAEFRRKSVTQKHIEDSLKW